MKIVQLIIVSLILIGCNSNLKLVKSCVDCLHEFNESKEALELLYNIEYYTGRPTSPMFSTDFKTLEKRLGIEFYPNLEMMIKIDTSKFYFSNRQFRIAFRLKLKEKKYEVILNDPQDLTIRNEDIILQLLKSMCKVEDADSTQLKTAVLEYGFNILKAQEEIGAYWFHGYSDYIEFNCASGSKRLIYSELNIDSLPLNSNKLLVVKKNWYYYNDEIEINDKHKRIINRKIKKYGW